MRSSSQKTCFRPFARSFSSIRAICYAFRARFAASAAFRGYVADRVSAPLADDGPCEKCRLQKGLQGCACSRSLCRYRRRKTRRSQAPVCDCGRAGPREASSIVGKEVPRPAVEGLSRWAGGRPLVSRAEALLPAPVRRRFQAARPVRSRPDEPQERRSRKHPRRSTRKRSETKRRLELRLSRETRTTLLRQAAATCERLGSRSAGCAPG